MATKGLAKEAVEFEVGQVITMKAQVAGKARSWHSHSGRSMVEVLAVVAIATILTAVAVPQVISARRLIRSAALPREIATQLRYARQQAMSQRQAFTFVYDDSTKQISIIDHQAFGSFLLTAPGYPNTAGSVTVLTIPVGGGGLPASEVTFGVPSVITNTTLSDTGTPTALVNNKLTVTFQPNGTVQDSTGKEVNYRTLYFYNNKIPTETACAVSILGSAGRIKIWRYTPSASQYLE
jgi:Tfp pilus assembly protein FimT